MKPTRPRTRSRRSNSTRQEPNSRRPTRPRSRPASSSYSLPQKPTSSTLSYRRHWPNYQQQRRNCSWQFDKSTQQKNTMQSALQPPRSESRQSRRRRALAIGSSSSTRLLLSSRRLRPTSRKRTPRAWRWSRRSYPLALVLQPLKAQWANSSRSRHRRQKPLPQKPPAVLSKQARWNSLLRPLGGRQVPLKDSRTGCSNRETRTRKEPQERTRLRSPCRRRPNRGVRQRQGVQEVIRGGARQRGRQERLRKCGRLGSTVGHQCRGGGCR